MPAFGGGLGGGEGATASITPRLLFVSLLTGPLILAIAVGKYCEHVLLVGTVRKSRVVYAKILDPTPAQSQ